ncbi:MAG: murein hydrolase activator EnvC family protein [Eubacterium sp.]
MRQQRIIFRVFAVLLAFCLFTVSTFPQMTVSADDSVYSEDYEGMSPEEKQAYIEQKLKEVNEKLDSLGEQSKETEEYINTLDEKIKYLQNELRLSQQEIEDSRNKITSLEKQQQDNETEIAQIKIDLEEMAEKSVKLQAEFDSNYQLFCQRIRAIYISGDTSVISMLLTCPDISTLLTRYEMIRRVSRSDKELLESVQAQAKELSETKTAMEEKQKRLTENQKTLAETEENLKSSMANLETQQVSYKEKQSAYESEKAESDELLRQLQEDTQTYSEYRNQDQAELEAVNAEIAKAAEEFKKKMEKQTTTKKAETTQATTKDKNSQSSTTKATTTQPTTANSNRLSMTYPVPSQTRITCDYGSAGYEGHTGVDFSCPTGSAVVAAESGYVFYTKELNYSYGYHIVIMHDKTDSAGNYVYTLYAHNSSLVVSAGQYVTKGQLIAYSGSTGNSTGPHCHFEVRTPTAQYSDCVNPKYYLP